MYFYISVGTFTLTDTEIWVLSALHIGYCRWQRTHPVKAKTLTQRPIPTNYWVYV